MGIPSYYRLLSKQNPKLISTTYKKSSDSKVVLCIDFNCIVYACLGSKNIPTYTRDNHALYEAKLIIEVCSYVSYIWKQAGSPSDVFIAVDGVVPMAKMKQQRLRRFKGVALAKYEIAQGVYSKDTDKWDKNAITPGTQFMKLLHKELEHLCSKHSGWSVSGYNEPGEGEHKIMKYVKAYSIKNSTFLVYGLDADLILLSMLHSTLHSQTLWLMREEMEFNHVVKDEFDKPKFMYFDIDALKHMLFKNPTVQVLLDYVMMMSFLGNDFLPHTVAFTIKERGYTYMFKILEERHSRSKYMISAEYKIDWSEVKDFLTVCSREEETFFANFCRKKQSTKFYSVNRDHATDYDIKMQQVQILPCKWFVEECLYTDHLVEGWRDIYYNNFLIGSKENIIQEYIKGLTWIVDYYLENTVEYDWYYPWEHVPLYRDIVEYIPKIQPVIYTLRPPLDPEQQLAIVLPVQSYGLVRNNFLKQLPLKYPQYFPTSFGYSSLGKKWFYECESSIPIITSNLLRGLLENSKHQTI